MPKRSDLKKVLVLGSGPIEIGQAAEFDYAGTQACQALREEGIEVVLVNSNPATIMTHADTADRVYIEPMTVDTLVRIMNKEKPDGLLATTGGQTGLNLAAHLARQGYLDSSGVELLGTDAAVIEKAEDREHFRNLMHSLDEPIPASRTISNMEQAEEFAETIGYPVIIRPAYTLGGTGGGIAASLEELQEIVATGLRESPIHQVLMEQSIAGYKEIEFEIIRDCTGTCVTVCGMENMDPVGIHTGDSIVVAPCQTLSDVEYEMLCQAAHRIVNALEIVGGCNVQFGLDPDSSQYYVIEVNPRVSRSSALASKATGYPIAKVSAKLALGCSLAELADPITGIAMAACEPVLDYVVTKIPRWPFDKFPTGNRQLGTQMKATGEVMAIGRTFTESINKAVRSLELDADGICLCYLSDLSTEALLSRLETADDERIFVIMEVLRREVPLKVVANKTDINLWFLTELSRLVGLEREVTQAGELTPDLLHTCKVNGMSDAWLAALSRTSPREVAAKRAAASISPSYRMVDTFAGGLPSQTPYYYSTYAGKDQVKVGGRPAVLVLGSGPIRIGQGIEFDYSTVHGVKAIQDMGYDAVVINNNPETVSTDYTVSDRLYFEPLSPEEVLSVVSKEVNLVGAVVQFGGQTALNLANTLAEAGVPLLGTELDNIDAAEDRHLFDAAMEYLQIPRPQGCIVRSIPEAQGLSPNLKYPVLVRPSYVLGGRAMEIVYSAEELMDYLKTGVQLNGKASVLIDRYLVGKEVEVDAVSDGDSVLIPGVMEHIERAGIHSGDSIAVYPTITLTSEQLTAIKDYTERIARHFRIKGLLNIQFVVAQGKVYVLEVNPRSSRTVPFLSKVTGIPIAGLAAQVLLGRTILDTGYEPGLYPAPDELVAVKVPVFSFAKLRGVEVTLGPEMKSTGEVMGRDRDLARALCKGLVAAKMSIPTTGGVLITVADKDKDEALSAAKGFAQLGFRLYATVGTGEVLRQAGLQCKILPKLSEGDQILQLVRSKTVDIVINTLTRGRQPWRDGFRIRRVAVESGVTCLTSLDTAAAILSVLQEMGPYTEPIGGQGCPKLASR